MAYETAPEPADDVKVLLYKIARGIWGLFTGTGTSIPVTPAAPSTTSNGLTQVRILDASSTAKAGKAAAGNLYGYNIVNPHSAAIYVKFYNKAAADVNPASDVPFLTVAVQATSHELIRGIDLPFSFSTALSVRAVTESGDTGTTAPGSLPIIELDVK